MPAHTRSQLLSITENEYSKLADLLARIDADAAMRKRDEGASIKDVIAHRAHWIDLFFGWYSDGKAGETVHFPAEGYKWNELKRYNADLRARQKDIDWPASVAMLACNHKRLMRLITELSEHDLYGGPMKGAQNTWTTGRWAEAAGASHYRSAAKYLRSCIKSDSTTLP